MPYCMVDGDGFPNDEEYDAETLAAAAQNQVVQSIVDHDFFEVMYVEHEHPAHGQLSNQLEYSNHFVVVASSNVHQDAHECHHPLENQHVGGIAADWTQSVEQHGRK